MYVCQGRSHSYDPLEEDLHDISRGRVDQTTPILNTGYILFARIDMILAGLHNGVIQLWDFRIGILIEKFEEHEGPVRGVQFHAVQPLFVSGADDYLVKVWNFHLKKCVFNLVGHLDYIRKVEFHMEYPWILSASDDQTIRIWNWQSRVCIAILTGHNHYVMCAEFHPNLDFVLSSSLDKTIRVWDIKLLREKNVMSKNENVLNDNKPYGFSKNVFNGDFLIGNNNENLSTYSFISNQQQTQHSVISSNNNSSNNNMFGASDAICKFVLEGHEKGVNCCTFHHNLPIIASGSDDKLVKLWRYNDSKCWEMDTLRGHFNNVSSLLFYRTNDDLLLSNSEDRTIRVWDISKRTCIHTFRRENDRFWILALKPNSNLIASGHDSGMVIFKFEKEKCPFDKFEQLFFYTKDKVIFLYHVERDSHVNLCSIRKNGNAMMSGYYKMIYNHFCTTHIMLLFIYKEEENFSFDLIVCDAINTANGTNTSNVTNTVNTAIASVSPLNFFKSWSRKDVPGRGSTPERGTGTGAGGGTHGIGNISVDSVRYVIKGKACCSAATFFTRNKYLFVEKRNNNIYILNIHNLPDDNLYKRIEIPFKVESVYTLTNNKLIICSENKIYLYDVNLKKIVNEMHHTDVILSVEILKEHIGFVFKYNIVITTIELAHVCTVHENIRVKSGVWDESHKNAFIYNTLSHLKYVLINGETGLIKYMEEPVYLFKIWNNYLYYINRQQVVKKELLNDTEYNFKLALINNDEKMAYHYLNMNNNTSKGQNDQQKKKLHFSYNLIGYIKKKGFANLAIQMVNNNHTIFNLSVQLGHLQNALKAAKKIDKKHIWTILSDHALLLGNYEIAEYALQRNKAYDKLSFLYFFSGNVEKLRKMLSISIIRNDFNSIFLNALYLGDIQQRIQIFIEQNHLSLALLCSHLYNIPINISEKHIEFDINDCTYCPKKSYYLSPPIPIVKICSNKHNKDNVSMKYVHQYGDKSHSEITWKNSYNWPYVNLETTYNHDIVGDRNNMDIKMNRHEKFNSSNKGNIYMQDEGENRNYKMGKTQTLFGVDKDIHHFNEIKSEEKSSFSEENDIWKDDVNDEDINIDLDVQDQKKILNKKNTKIEKGENIIYKSLKKNGKIIDHIKAANIKTALKLISKKYGIVDMKPLKLILKNVYISTYAYMTPMQNFLSLKIPINTNEYTMHSTMYITKHFLFNQIKKAHKLVTLGKFSVALNLFRSVLYHMVFIHPSSGISGGSTGSSGIDGRGENDEKELNEYLCMCTSYILAMRLEEERNTTATKDPRRSLELMAYFTCCALQNSHLYLVLRRGMGLAWKAQNYITAGSFAKRLVNGNYENIKGSDEEIIKAKKILLMCEQKSTEHYTIDYDPNDYGTSIIASARANVPTHPVYPFNVKICSMSLTRIKPNEDVIACPFCQSIAKKEFSSRLCPNCVVAQLGIKALGFDFLNKNV
ncbi:coatomer alpha subunit, putative [Plasmodium ovale curtisi]|uniref:Coatomer alpha subunit, putative n=1 Tax=Plasmodium ovale curtisi TaxID=864141 RepID=A0A1A8WRB3_PLAOA|nr:coatomer alpha subunit, putative [Plasmodium ovale curtisi]